MLKSLSFFISLILVFNKLTAQDIYVSGGMGLNNVTMESLNDYLRYNSGFNNRRDDAHTAIEFYSAVGSKISYNVLLEASFGYSLNSFSKSALLGTYQLEYVFYLPEFMFIYDIPYNYYGFQFGAGFGFYLGSVSETQYGTMLKVTEETKGWGFQLKSVFYAALSRNLSAEIIANYRNSFLNDLYIFEINTTPARPLNLSFNSLGIKLGVRYFL